jgi:hypothetical protein
VRGNRHAFLLSVGLAMPVVTEQVGAGLTDGRWNAVPILTVLTRMGSPPQFDWGAAGSVAAWLLSCETGFLIPLTATAFGCAVWMLEAVRSRLSPG